MRPLNKKRPYMKYQIINPMDSYIFILTISLMAIGMVAIVLPLPKKIEVAKAGKVNVSCSRYKQVQSIPSFLKKDDKIIKLSKYKVMIVHGFSMCKYFIYDNQCIFIKTIDSSQKGRIVDYPVLVFTISESTKNYNLPKNDAIYKLRKFVGYVKLPGDPTADEFWKSIYKKYKNRIRIDIKDFCNQCINKINNNKELFKADNNIVLSETLDETSGCTLYSLHSIDSIYAQVMYACWLKRSDWIASQKKMQELNQKRELHARN